MQYSTEGEITAAPSGSFSAIFARHYWRCAMNRELARTIYQRSHLVGDFLLRSGQRSREYFDKYRFESDPQLLDCIVAELQQLLPSDAEVLAGLELGGIPLATALALRTGLPLAFVRKKAKEYGTCKRVEGAEVAGRAVVVVEDVVTSGGQVVDSIAALRDEGARVEVALCVVDREQGGVQLLAEHGIELRALFRASELKAAAEP